MKSLRCFLASFILFYIVMGVSHTVFREGRNVGMSDLKLHLRVTHDKVSICKLPAGSPMPMWAFEGDFFSITKTPDELSIICSDGFIPADVRRESGFRVIMVEGKLDFSLTGILASVSSVLAAKGISIFAVSTFNTDYILVKGKDLDAAVDALAKAGHSIRK